jgi:hypothetical protein
MTVEELFAWLKKNNAKIAFGFKKSIPYVSLHFGTLKMRYTKEGELGEIEEALIGLINQKVAENGQAG